MSAERDHRVDPVHTSADLRAFRAVMQHGLVRPGAPRVTVEQPLTPEEFTSLLGRVVEGRITGVLLGAASTDAVALNSEQLAEAADAHELAMARVLRLESSMLDAVAVLESVDVQPIVLKGSAAAHTILAEPEQRDFVDIDLLVPAAGVDRSVATLQRYGLRRYAPEVRPGFDRRFAKSVTMYLPSGDELDLHRTLAPGPFGAMIDLCALHASTMPFTLAGHRLRALDRPHALVHSAYHVALGSTFARASALRDCAILLEAPDVVFADVLAIARAWRGQPVLAAAIKHVDDQLGLGDTAAVRWARGYMPSAAEQRMLSVYTDPTRRSTTTAIETLRVLPSWRDRIAYSAMLAVPSRAARNARDATNKTRLRRLRRALRRS